MFVMLLNSSHSLSGHGKQQSMTATQLPRERNTAWSRPDLSRLLAVLLQLLLEAPLLSVPALSLLHILVLLTVLLHTCTTVTAYRCNQVLATQSNARRHYSAFLSMSCR